MKKILVFVIAMLAISALACGGGGGTPSGQAAATPAPSGSGGQSPAKATTVPTQPAPSDEEDLTLGTLTDGLATLNSYKGHMVIKFAGKDDQGQPVSGDMDMVEEFIANPRTRRISATTTGGTSEGQAGTFELVSIGDTNYMVFQDQSGERSCVSMASDQASQLEQGLFSPDSMGGVSGAKYVKTETVNGVKAKHYTWQEGASSLASLGFSKGKGDVWVAADGNYVVKYTAEATGGGALFGASSTGEGTVMIEYNLSEVNGSFKIEPPEGCQAPASDLPIMDDAQDKTTTNELVMYSTPSPFADVVEFYKTEMAGQGWQASGEPTEMEGLASFEFTKDKRKAQVMISEDTDNNKVGVMISISEE